jgi:uncharacterized membrane protein
MTVKSMTLNQKYYLGAAAVIFATLVGTLVAYPSLPNIVPIHWDAHGQVNGWGPKWSRLLYGPGMMALMVLVTAALPWLSPKKIEVDSFRGTYLYIMIVIVAALAYIQILILLSSLGMALDVGRVCLLITLLGNVLGKVRRNFYVGIRTPWTLASDAVWNRTHRLGAKTFFVCGLLGLLAIVLRAPFSVPVIAILVAAFVPVIYSLMYYKQLEHRGELN